MPISKEGGRYRYQFKRIVAGRRVRASKLLPKGWTQKQADDYDTKETARIYAAASGQKSEPLIEDAVLLYCKERCPALKTGKEVMRQLNADFELYQGKLFSELPQVAKEICKANQSQATKRNRIAYLRSACRYAFKHHEMGEHDPASRLVMPKVDNERQVYVDRAEMLSIAKQCRPASRPFIRIAFYSGMRLSEILRAGVRNDNFVLETSKNKSPRLIPIHPKIVSALRHLPPRIARSTIQDHFREARDAAGLPQVTFHTLRHSAASAMINEDVDLYTVGGVLGHKDPRSTKRYAHLATRTLGVAVRKIGRKRPDELLGKTA